MHNLPSGNGVQNASDPRSPLQRLRLSDLKKVLEAEGLRPKINPVTGEQLTAHQARDILASQGVDVNKYMAVDAQGNLYFNPPKVVEKVVEKEPETKPATKKSK